jgi:imidazolonepropionase
MNAACSLGLGDVIGSIELGKSADFVVFDAEDPAEIPYWVGASIVHKVYARGRLAFSTRPEETK